MKHPRVAFISHTSILGGAERVLLELTTALQARGVECLVFMPSEGPLRETLQRVGVRSEIVNYSWWSNQVRKVRRNLNNIAGALRLAKAFRREKIDIVYSNTTMVPSGAFAAKLCGLPHIWHAHEFGREDHGLEIDIGERLGLWLLGVLSTKVICVSKAVEAKYQKHVPGEKLRTIYATVTVVEGAPAPKKGDSVTCVLVGVLRPSKGQREAIEAIDLLAREGLDVRLVVVGSGPSEEELRNLIAAKNLGGRVEMTGYAENPFPHVEAADMLLMCSRCEASGRVPLEAMMLGKPVVGSRSGGTVEEVRDHFNGLLYEPGDAGDLAEKIRYLAHNLDYTRKLGANGREWVKATFTIDRFADEVLDVLLDATRPASAPAR